MAPKKHPTKKTQDQLEKKRKREAERRRALKNNKENYDLYLARERERKRTAKELCKVKTGKDMSEAELRAARYKTKVKVKTWREKKRIASAGPRQSTPPGNLSIENLQDSNSNEEGTEVTNNQNVGTEDNQIQSFANVKYITGNSVVYGDIHCFIRVACSCAAQCTCGKQYFAIIKPKHVVAVEVQGVQMSHLVKEIPGDQAHTNCDVVQVADLLCVLFKTKVDGQIYYSEPLNDFELE